MGQRRSPHTAPERLLACLLACLLAYLMACLLEAPRGCVTPHRIATSVLSPPKTKMVKAATMQVVCRMARLSVIASSPQYSSGKS